jgi:hypothetical protein
MHAACSGLVTKKIPPTPTASAGRREQIPLRVRRAPRPPARIASSRVACQPHAHPRRKNQGRDGARPRQRRPAALGPAPASAFASRRVVVGRQLGWTCACRQACLLLHPLALCCLQAAGCCSARAVSGRQKRSLVN